MTSSPVAETLREWLAGHRLEDDGRCLVAYSGGPDSTVLLHALAALREQTPGLRLAALHVDHGLDPDSRAWARHCRTFCRQLDIVLRVKRLPRLDPVGGTEAAARDARYAWFATCVEKGDVLLTAHHRGDQAETLLYHLFRGTGVRGLAAMPAERAFAGGTLARPLLGLPRQSLLEYARLHGLDWIDDPANATLDQDRNFIRHRLVPAVLERWPGAERNLARAAINAGEATAILDRRAEEQVNECRVDAAFHPLSAAPVLSGAALAGLPAEDCLNVLRYWMRESGLPLPSRQRMQRLHRDLVTEAPARGGSFAWAGASVRRYRGALYLVPPLPADLPGPAPWRTDTPFDVPGVPLSLIARQGLGRGIAIPSSGALVTVDFATEDRVIRVRPGGPRRSLRKLFQEAGVPPWVRRVLPRVSLDGELLCVPGLVQSGAHRAPDGQPDLCFELVPRPRESGVPGGVHR